VGVGGTQEIQPGIFVDVYPKIVLLPAFAASFGDLRKRFPRPKDVQISAGSSLIIDGDVTIESLDLDGAMVVKASKGATIVIKEYVVKNTAGAFERLPPPSKTSAKTTDIFAMRGYKVAEEGGHVCNKPKYVLREDPIRHVIRGKNDHFNEFSSLMRGKNISKEVISRFERRYQDFGESKRALMREGDLTKYINPPCVGPLPMGTSLTSLVSKTFAKARSASDATNPADGQRLVEDTCMVLLNCSNARGSLQNGHLVTETHVRSKLELRLDALFTEMELTDTGTFLSPSSESQNDMKGNRPRLIVYGPADEVLSVLEDRRKELERFTGDSAWSSSSSLNSVIHHQEKHPSILLPGQHPGGQWYSPGGGDFFLHLQTSGLLEELKLCGYKYMFVATASNIGASLSLDVLRHFVAAEAPCMLEVCDRTHNDAGRPFLAKRKGDDAWKVLHPSECEEGGGGDFNTMRRHVSTGNMWLDLEKLARFVEGRTDAINLATVCHLHEEKGSSELGHCVPPTVTSVLLETPATSVLGFWPDSAVVRVPRSRFIELDTVSDYFLFKANVYTEVGDNIIISKDHEDPASIPAIDLDADVYPDIHAVQQIFRKGSNATCLNLKKCRSLTLRGKVVFEKPVVVVGDVTFVGGFEARAVKVPGGTFTDGTYEMVGDHFSRKKDRSASGDSSIASGSQTKVNAPLAKAAAAAPRSAKEKEDLYSDLFLLACFHLIDRSNDGFLQIKELTTAFGMVKGDLSVFYKLDEDQDGSVSLEEFQKGVQALPRTPSLENQLRKWKGEIKKSTETNGKVKFYFSPGAIHS
jgi:Ca2+-binding EF-hand superfamily protein